MLNSSEQTTRQCQILTASMDSKWICVYSVYWVMNHSCHQLWIFHYVTNQSSPRSFPLYFLFLARRTQSVLQARNPRRRPMASFKRSHSPDNFQILFICFFSYTCREKDSRHVNWRIDVSDKTYRKILGHFISVLEGMWEPCVTANTTGKYPDFSFLGGMWRKGRQTAGSAPPRSANSTALHAQYTSGLSPVTQLSL